MKKTITAIALSSIFTIAGCSLFFNNSERKHNFSKNKEVFTNKISYGISMKHTIPISDYFPVRACFPNGKFKGWVIYREHCDNKGRIIATSATRIIKKADYIENNKLAKNPFAIRLFKEGIVYLDFNEDGKIDSFYNSFE